MILQGEISVKQWSLEEIDSLKAPFKSVCVYTYVCFMFCVQYFNHAYIICSQKECGETINRDSEKVWGTLYCNERSQKRLIQDGKKYPEMLEEEMTEFDRRCVKKTKRYKIFKPRKSFLWAQWWIKGRYLILKWPVQCQKDVNGCISIESSCSSERTSCKEISVHILTNFLHLKSAV